MAEATAYMAIAISKVLTPWKVGSSDAVKVCWAPMATGSSRVAELLPHRGYNEVTLRVC